MDYKPSELCLNVMSIQKMSERLDIFIWPSVKLVVIGEASFFVKAYTCHSYDYFPRYAVMSDILIGKVFNKIHSII